MTTRAIAAPGFPGTVVLAEERSPQAARAVVRSAPSARGAHVSRSYRGCFGLLAVSHSRVGVDLELVDTTVCRDAVLTPGELNLGGTPAMWCDWWSAKEALAKALGNARLYDPRRLESPSHWDGGRAGRWACSALELPRGLVGWVVWEAADATDQPLSRGGLRHRTQLG